MSSIAGAEVIAGPFTVASLENTRAAEVPDEPGLYLWRRSVATAHAAYNDTIAEQLIRRHVESPLANFSTLRLSAQADTGATEIRSHYITIERLGVGAASVSEQKLLPEDHAARTKMLELIARISIAFGPVVYVGETKSLRARVLQHLSQRSGLADRMIDCGMQMQDLCLFFITLGDSTKADRQKLEKLATHVTGAPLTRKAGA